MSSIVVSGDSSEGRADNPIELDDSSSNSDIENETPPGPRVFKLENTDNEEGGDSGGESESESESDGNDGNGDEEEEEDEDEEEDEEDNSVEDGDEENTEADADNEVDVESINEEELENEHKNEEEDTDDDGEDDDDDNDDGSDGKNDNDENDSTNSASKATEDASNELRRAKRMKTLWGNIESMSDIVKSPYEGDECAEVGEDCFEEFRLLMDSSQTDDPTNPKMVALVGDKLARDLYNARQEIGKSGMLYSANWKEGKIRDSDFGWIPKRQLLLCLHEHRFAKGDVLVLQAVTKNLDCTKLVLEAMKLWDLMDSYPNLASNKNEESFVFGVQKVFCYKCQIFVARAFATLQILNKTEEIQQSLTKKIKKCLGIMNKHVRVNQVELARMKKKALKRKALEGPPCSEEPDVATSKSPRSRKSENSRSRAKSASSRESRPKGSKPRGRKPTGPRPRDPISTSGAKKATRTRKRRRKIPKREEREESIFMLFNTMHMQVQRLNQMMSFFQSQLQDHRGILREEIRENIENDGNP